VTDRLRNGGMKLVERAEPQGRRSPPLRRELGDFVVQVHALGIHGDETVVASNGSIPRRDRRPSLHGQRVAGGGHRHSMGNEGAVGGQRGFGLTEWTATASWRSMWPFEARNLRDAAGDVDLRRARPSRPGMPAWKGLSEHGRLQRAAERPRARCGRRSRFDGKTSIAVRQARKSSAPGARGCRPSAGSRTFARRSSSGPR